MNLTIHDSTWPAPAAAGAASQTKKDTMTDWGTTSETYASTYRSMLRVAFAITGNAATAEDAVQDAFVSVGPKIGTLENPIPYLRVAVVNRCRSIHRHASTAPTAPSVEHIMLDSGLIDFGDALDTLPFAQRTAIVLRYLCDLSDPEIADILHCRRSTVRSHVKRGLASLRQELS